ncbi:SHOCT domain-containing protein [Geminicoccus harenae]|nr:SHOCT domain-containing protein [Geminicoccus harenae]
MSKLERLAALRVAGVLTDQEFTDQKRRILAG